ncbi:hypothetical protein [Actinomadura chokoriensis]|uniref:Endonuclease/exonuclease/phosphatase family protein n=1 Tax=Actinomadura chokoriensis TaxID=454156 RepID=A0ABV4R2Y9_9ACTN
MAGPWTVMSVNTQYGGRFDSDGRPVDRWGPIADAIASVEPHILLAQELTGWGHDPRLHAAAERSLQRRGWPLRFLVAPSATGFHTAVAYQPEVLCWRQYETKYAHLTDNGYGVAVLADVDADEDEPGLTVISAHLSAYSTQAAAQEAQRMAVRLHRYGGRGILGGDINNMPLGDREPDWAAVPPYNRSARCLPRTGPDEPWRGNRAVGEVLANAGLVDVAAHLADTQHRPELRAATGRGRVRVDQYHVTEPLRDALLDYERLPGLSDHDAIVMRLDSARLGAARVWD